MTLLVLTFVTPLVPLAALVFFARSRPPTPLEFALNTVITGGVVAIFYSIGTWVFLSYYLRFVLIAGFVGVAVWRGIQMRKTQGQTGNPGERSGDAADGSTHGPHSPNAAGDPSRRESGGRTRRYGGLSRWIAAIIVVWLAVLVRLGYTRPTNVAVDLTFPLIGGRYCIVQGGRNFVTNPFHNFIDSEYAVDIVKMNLVGNRARGIAPRDTRRYEIFGDPVYSPIGGTIVAVIDTLFDNRPPRANPLSPLGNHIVIANGAGLDVIVAHLRKKGALVHVGDTVERGDPIGRVGNSGYSNEPHLHIQVLRTDTQPATPVPFTIDGRFLAINDVVIRW